MQHASHIMPGVQQPPKPAALTHPPLPRLCNRRSRLRQVHCQLCRCGVESATGVAVSPLPSCHSCCYCCYPEGGTNACSAGVQVLATLQHTQTRGSRCHASAASFAAAAAAAQPTAAQLGVAAAPLALFAVAAMQVHWPLSSECRLVQARCHQEGWLLHSESSAPLAATFPFALLRAVAAAAGSRLAAALPCRSPPTQPQPLHSRPCYMPPAMHSMKQLAVTGKSLWRWR